MRLILLHSDRIWVEPRKKALKDAKPAKGLEVEDCLVVFTAFEERDEAGDPIPNAVKEILDIMGKIKANKVVIYPWVHLTSSPSSSLYAEKMFNELYNALEAEDVTTYLAPFGYYKEFEIHVKGHPLAEWSRDISPVPKIKDEDKEEELEEEGELEDIFVILPTGDIKRRNQLSGHPEVELAIKSELGEITNTSFGKPPHLELMRRLEIADYEEISDAGNLRFYPNGAFISKLLEMLGWKMAVDDLNALPVNTPYIINPSHPSVSKMMSKFPERLYRVLPGSAEKKQEFRLRPACDYGVWSMLKDAVLTYKSLPLGLYEYDVMWRYEQRGELLGLYRLRNAHMPNLHEVCKDVNQAFDRFQEHIEKFAIALYKYLDLDPEVVVLNCKKDFYNDHKEVFEKWAKEINIPIVVKLFSKMKTYKVAWVDVIAFDTLGRPMEINTVQLDTESPDWWGIKYINEHGKEVRPLILHTGFGVERAIAAVLEKAASDKSPALPTWLSPIQIRFIPVREDYVDMCVKLAEKARELGVRADVNDKSQPLGKRIREAERQWIPYVVVVGEKEINGELSVRVRKGKSQEKMSLEELVSRVKKECKGRPYLPSPFPTRLSNRSIFVGAN